jgi:hypothetical protein
MNIEELKTQLIEKIKSQADWREHKATEERPEDSRNRQSADSLRKLAERMGLFPTTDARWVKISNSFYGPRWWSSDAHRFDDTDEFTEIESEALRRYGFHREQDGDPAEFLDSYIEMIEAIRTRRAEMEFKFSND